MTGLLYPVRFGGFCHTRINHKEAIYMKQKTGRKLLSFLLTLAMVVGLMPGMGLTTQAATYSSGTSIIVMRNANSLAAGDILESGVTLTTVDKKIYVVIFFDGNEKASASAYREVSWTADKAYKVVSYNERKSTTFSLCELRLQTCYKVTITGGTNATTNGATSQPGLTGAMTTVTFTANSGCQFPATSNYYTTTNGITVARTSATVVTVSGTPTADTAITVPDAVAVSKTALENKITEATDYCNGIASGDSYVPVKDMLNTAIDTATGVKKNDDCDQTTVDNAVTALDNALNSAKAIVSVIDQITNIPESTGVTTGNKDAIEAAGKAYDDLTDEQKEMVDKTGREKLEAAEVALVDDIFEELPNREDVTTDDQDAIEAARKAYNDLTDEQKEKVDKTQREKLEAAEVALVDDILKKLPDSEEVTTDNKDAIEEAREAYGTLTQTQKDGVDKERLAKLEAAESALEAAEVENQLESLPAGTDVTKDNKTAIEEAREAYQALTYAQKKQVSADALKQLEEAESALEVIGVKEKLDALPAGDAVKAADKTAIKEAREAYEALSVAGKEQIPADTVSRLEEAEAALARLEEAEVALVEDELSELPESNEITTDNKEQVKTAVEAAQAAYDA